MIRMSSSGTGWGVRGMLAVLAVWVAVADARVPSEAGATAAGIDRRTVSAQPAVRWTATDLAALTMMVLGAAVPFIPMSRRKEARESGSDLQNPQRSSPSDDGLSNSPGRLGRVFDRPSCDWAVRSGVGLNPRSRLGVAVRVARG